MRLAILTSHPIQYYAPLFREIAGRIPVKVFFAHHTTPSQQAAAGGGRSLCFADTEGLSSLVPALSQALSDIATNPSSFGKVDASAYKDYTARSVAAKFATIFEEVVQRRVRN